MKEKIAIAVLAGGLKKEKDGTWRTTTFEDKGDKFGLDGHRLRIVAASYLYNNNPDFSIIVLGGKGQLKNVSDAPFISDVMREELISLGVAKESIIQEKRSGNTYQNIQELKKIILEKSFSHILIISNRCHLSRIHAMIERDENLNKMLASRKIEIEEAENIAIQYDPQVWKTVIASAYKSEAMKKRIALEEKGVRDIKVGTYKFR